MATIATHRAPKAPKALTCSLNSALEVRENLERLAATKKVFLVWSGCDATERSPAERQAWNSRGEES